MLTLWKKLRMMGRIAKYVLTDACYWLALFDNRDEHHNKSKEIYEKIEKTHILLPWPILYEVVCTRFVRNKIIVSNFFNELKKPNITYIYDDLYRERALEDSINYAIQDKRHISLVDSVIRYILLDSKYKIDYLITFNEGDFIDICKKKKVPIYYPDN